MCDRWKEVRRGEVERTEIHIYSIKQFQVFMQYLIQRSDNPECCMIYQIDNG